MRRWATERAPAAALIVFLVLAPTAGAEEAPPPASAPQETEYDNGTVLLVDHDSGMLGVSFEDDQGVEQKLSFRVDTASVDVTNPMNHELSFSQIQVGDHVDVFCEVLPDGTERVIQIWDYNRIDSGAMA
jgi:hypothetical protein